MVHIAPALENTPHSEMNRSILGERIQRTKALVDDTIGKMRERERGLIEEKGKIIEEIALMCAKSNNDAITLIGRNIRESGDVNAGSARLWKTILMFAVISWNIELVKLLLTHPNILINEDAGNWHTALYLAAINHEKDMVIEILNDPRLNLREHNQWVVTLRLTSDEEIRALIEAKMREQGIKF